MKDEAAAKRQRALASAGPFQTSEPADVRWLLCGRGRPVAAGSSAYAVRVTEHKAIVFYQDIEASRVLAEERWDELGYEPVAYPWYDAVPAGPPAPDLRTLRRALVDDELERYRAAGRDVAAAFVEVVGELRPDTREIDVTALLAERLHARGFTTPVLLAGGEERAQIHRHPLPTASRLGRFVLFAATAEREGLHVSMTRIASFGAPPPRLRERVEAAAAVDAALLDASRPGVTLAQLFGVLEAAYADVGFPDEWRLHHQGGITGYAGREVFATPGAEAVLPDRCALAWNPSVTGGGKSEDTALVTPEGVEVITRTPELGELTTAAGRPRPAIAEL
jgi:Xaa-Pro aminopeptidase